MGLKKIKPIYLIFDHGITLDQMAGTIQGISATLHAAKVEGLIEIFYSEKWSHEIEIESSLYPSILHWFLKRGRDTSQMTGRLNAATILDGIKSNPLQTKEPHYCAVVVKEPIHSFHTVSGQTEYITCSGVALPGYGFVMSAGECARSSHARQIDFCAFLSSHELGHVFNLVADGREKSFTDRAKGYTLGHCLNICTMLSGWKFIWLHRATLKKDPFCKLCKSGLIGNFHTEDRRNI